jgi:D-aminopeptidase
MSSVTISRTSAVIDTRKLDALLAGQVRGGEPGFVVGLAVDGQPIYKRAFGVAAAGQGDPLSTATVMSIGSISKHFTAFAYLLLCDDGLASPDDTLGKFLPDLHTTNRDARVVDVMAHVSGLWDGCDASILADGPAVARTVADLVSFYRQSDGYNFPAREGWDYNNGGYELLTTAVEAISGTSLREFLAQRVFGPLGMKNSQLLSDSGRSLPGAAVPHVKDGDAGWKTPQWGVSVGGAGGVVSTADDMLLWLAHMRKPRIGSARTWALMQEPQVLRNGFSTGYGMGLGISERHGVTLIGHTGGGGGSNAQMVRMPDAGIDLVVQSNRGDIWSVDLSYRIMEALFGWPVGERQAGDAPAKGNFYSHVRNSVLELRQWEATPALAIDDMLLPIEKDSTGSWKPTPGFDFYRFRLPPDAISSDTVILEDYGEAVVFARCEPEPRQSLSAFAGRYRSPATSTEIEILSGEQLRFEGRFGQAVYGAEQIGNQIWILRDESNPDFVRATLRIEDDGNSLIVTTSRNRCMPYRRVA